MSQKYEKLKTLLKELFQLDQPDLDFGLYRVMHAKSAEVSQFLDKDLLPQVQAAFGNYKTAEKAEIEKELAKVIAGIEAAGMNPAQSPKVKDLRERMKSDAVDLGALESEVYDCLFSFFRRYYSEGDFLAKRVYRPGVYAIPYEGEEVTLHWANKDQYYIKTSEYLRDYAFRLRPDDDRKPMRVHFRLADAAEGEHGNVKAAEGKDRLFILAAPGEAGRDFLAEDEGESGKELVIRFEYRPATLTDWPEDARTGKTKPPAQKDLTALAVKRVLTATGANLAPWVAELGKPHATAAGEKADYTRLEAHLKRYTARNTFDYFIHKDLGTFLRRELDFYIKNEVMYLDDVENESVPRVEQYLSKIKVVRKIAGKIIDFLAQLEDFQKKLWLKKKFVVETNYCITLDRIPEALYPEIAANDAQRQEWVRLFAIDGIQADMANPGYSVPLTVEFLKANPLLVVDTAKLGFTLRDRLLDRIDDIDDAINGVLVEADNFHALELCRHTYREKIRVTYIDPPFNLEHTGNFVYKVDYKDSSWATMLESRFALMRDIMTIDGSVFVRCDYNGNWLVRNVLNQVLGLANFRNEIVVRRGAESIGGLNEQFDTIKSINTIYDNLYWYSRDPATRFQKILRPASDTQKTAYWHSFWKSYDRPNMRYALLGVIPPRGQWLWKQADAITAAENYERFLRDSANTGETLEAYWRRKGENLKFIKQEGSKNSVHSVKYWVAPRNYALTDNNWLDIRGYSSNWDFKTENSEDLLDRCIQYLTDPDDVVCDFYAGSGTTLAVAHKLGRRWLGVELGDHVRTVICRRLVNVLHGEQTGISRASEWSGGGGFKYIRLESYEDALNNLDVRRTVTQRTLLDAAEAQGADGLREQYTLRYMLDVETRGSPSLLNVQAFTDPTAYKLKVKRPGSDESREVNVDLLETFNWLIGLTVRHIAAPQTFSAAFERDGEKRLHLKARLKQEVGGPYWFRTVTGTTSDGRRTLIIWRKLTGEPEQDNLVLDEWFTRQGYSAKDSEFDLIYVNGGNNLENLKTPDDLWKVRLIEEDFHRLMFEMEGA